MNGTPTILGVLLVDDNAAWAQRVTDLIEAALPYSNRRVRWEGTITKGIAALADFHADAVWLDLDLPDSRPEETIECVRGDKFPHPVYVFSDHFDPLHPLKDPLVMQCVKAGAYRCCTKDLGTVEEIIREQVWRLARLTFHPPAADAQG